MAGQFDPKRIPPGSNLELYIKATCPYCRQAMNYYDEAGTPYIVHDAQNDMAARRQMFEYTGGDPTVPAIIVDGRCMQSGWGSPPQG